MHERLCEPRKTSSRPVRSAGAILARIIAASAPGGRLVYAKFGTTPHVHAHNLNPVDRDEYSGTDGSTFTNGVPSPHAHAGDMLSPADENIITQYQDARSELRPLWNRNWFFFGLPGFTLIMVGDNYKSSAIQFFGVLIFMIGFVRAWILCYRYMRCPACNAFLSTAFSLCIPYRKCNSCGARLSHGWKDSM